MIPLTQTIQDQYEKLPAGERKIADILLEIPGEFTAYSATELAERAGVSKATATRLVRRLGFADYQQMRQQARESRRSGSPLAAFSGSRRGDLATHLHHDVACLTQTLEGTSPWLARKAVEVLTRADRVWVVGFRNSHALALYARELLVQVKTDVRLLPAPGQTVAEELSGLSKRDVMLVIAFRRRPPVLAKIIRAAEQAAARVVLIGDPSLVGLGRAADVTLRCFSSGSSLFDSYVAPISLINYLCSGVATALGEFAQMRLRRTEQLYETFNEL
jgi:DNA-binding MurR/RpiR family transcriptional regulator